MARASDLALSLTSTIQAGEADHLPPSAQELQEIADQKREFHVILTFLWEVSRKLMGGMTPRAS